MTALQEPVAQGVPAPREPVAPAPAPVAPRRRLAGRCDWLLRPLLLFCLSRLLVLLSSAAGALLATRAGEPLVDGPWPEVASTGIGAVDGLLRWDSAWYLHIAEGGYGPGSPDARNAFFPLLPVLVRLVASVPGVGGLVEAGLLVAHVAGAAATVLVWLLGRRLADRDAADRMAALFAFFPGSAVLSMVYAEGLLVALAAGTLLALHRRQWLVAGLLAAVATSSRPNAVAVAAACAWAALAAVAWPRRWASVHIRAVAPGAIRMRLPRRRQWGALVAPVLAPVGLLAFLGYLAVRTGDRAAWFSAQRAVWGERVDLGGQVDRVLLVIGDPASPLGGLNTWLPVVGMAVMALGWAALAAWRPGGAVIAYTAAACALVLVSATIGARPRMVLAAFPLVMALAYVVRGPAFSGLLAGSAGLGALLTVVNVASTTGTP